MSKLTDAIAAARGTAKPPIEQWFATLDETDQKALVEALLDPAVSTAALVRIIKECGQPVSKDTVAAWRSRHGFTR